MKNSAIAIGASLSSLVIAVALALQVSLPNKFLLAGLASGSAVAGASAYAFFGNRRRQVQSDTPPVESDSTAAAIETTAIEPPSWATKESAEFPQSAHPPIPEDLWGAPVQSEESIW